MRTRKEGKVVDGDHVPEPPGGTKVGRKVLARRLPRQAEVAGDDETADSVTSLSGTGSITGGPWSSTS